MLEWVQELAVQKRCKVINLMDNNDQRAYCTDLLEFLYLIQNCILMVTDSFHGSVFSILFGKPFVVMDRKDEFVSMNSRIDNLLEVFNLQKRKISNLKTDGIFSIDYQQAHTILSAKRIEAEKFLKEAIEDL